MPQSYASHAHHPVPTYIAAVFTLIALVCLIGAWLLGWPTLAAGAVSLACAVVMLVAISRIYTARLQDRIIRLEMTVRCTGLLPPEQTVLLDQLDTKQIVALRFASDQELGALLQRSASERLPPDAIKQAIQHWRADDLRT